MRVLYLIDTLNVGGAEKSLLEIISHFQSTEAAMCHIYPGDSLKPAYQTAQVPVISLNTSGNYSFRQAIQQVRQVIQEQQPDLIHTALFRADIVGRLAGQYTGIPVIGSFVNESYSPLRKQALPLGMRLKLRCIQSADAWTAKFCTHFTANSSTIKQINAKTLGIPSKKVSVIYRGRNPDPLTQVGQTQVEQTRCDLGLSHQNRVILNVGRLLYRKGQADLIHAMPRILQHNPHVRLIIAGEGDYKSHLQRLIKQLGIDDAVKLIGERTDIPTLLHLAEVFVFPSHYEGYPGALVEAMLAGRSIAASDIPVHHEAITIGHTGSMFAVQDPAAIAKTVLWVLEHPAEAKAMAYNGQHEALSRFHIDHIAAQHEQLYVRVLDEWRTQQ